MSEMLADFRTRVQSLSQVPTTVVDSDATDADIAKAVNEYSRKRPLVTTKAFSAATNSNTYTLTDIVAGWGERYQVEAVSYHVSSGRRIAVDENCWQVQETDGAYSLFLQDYLEVDGERVTGSPSTYYLTYTYPHTLTAVATTVRADDLEALSYLAASYCCSRAARQASDEKASTYVSDVVDYQSIADKWHKAARELKKVWEEHVKGRTGGNSAQGEWDIRSARGRMIWHGSRRF